MGVFHHYDYFNNQVFELGNLTFNGGLLSKLAFGPKSFLYTNLHLGLVPFGRYSIKPVADTASLRDFNYGGGTGAKFEGTLNIHNFINMNISVFYYWMSTYSGTKENNLIGIIRPTVLFQRGFNMLFPVNLFF